MSSLRRTVPLLKEVCTGICRREFRREFNSSVSVKAVVRMSPRVARANKIQSGTATRVKKTYSTEEALPPVVLLQSAYKAGALEIKPDICMTFLQEYAEYLPNQTLGQDRMLCETYGIKPLHMAILASILNRCNSIPQKSLGKKLMFSASELGEKSATFELISSALRTNTIHDYDAPLRRLGMLAKKDNDPQAMLLLGKVMLGRKGNREALEWFQKATREPTGNLQFDGAGEALVQEGRILQAQGAPLGARKAFEKAALELDDPTAYFYLSKMEEFGSKKQEIYLMKASTAGILEAWHNLGALELAKETEKEIKTMNDYGMAREWFLVAAADGFGLSMLNLALMHRSVGDLEGGMAWLDKAEEVDDVADEAMRVRRAWESEENEKHGEEES